MCYRCDYVPEPDNGEHDEPTIFLSADAYNGVVVIDVSDIPEGEVCYQNGIFASMLDDPTLGKFYGVVNQFWFDSVNTDNGIDSNVSGIGGGVKNDVC